MTQEAMIITFSAFFLIPVSCAILVAQTRNLKKKMGSLEYAFARKMKVLHVLILVCTPILIGLNFIRELEILTVFAVSGAGVLGFAIGLKDLLYTRMGGIYENGLLWTAASVFYANIEEYNRPDESSLIVLTRDRTQKTIILNDKELLSRIGAKLDECIHPLQ